MDEEYEKLVESLKNLFGNLSDLGENPTPEDVEAALGDADVDDVSPEEFTAAVKQALLESGADPATVDQVIDQLEAQPGWGEESPVNGLTVVVNNNQIVNEIDQSLHVDGEVHGDIIQENTSNVANATGEGAVAGDDVAGNQIQTGDGQQVGGNSGVQNQGDNSGQQAGGNADADNITTGDDNTVGSGEASQIGQGQISQDYATLNDSSQAFGAGSVDQQSNDSESSEFNASYEESAEGSYNTEISDDDSQTQVAEVHGGYDEEYEAPFEDDSYEGGGYDGDDNYEVDDHSVEQGAAIIDAD